MESGEDHPRAFAFLICQMALPTLSNGLNLIEVGSDVYTWQFPGPLPPHFAVCMLIGGRPKTVYSTEWAVVDPRGDEVGRIPGPDAPFTSQIRRVNTFTPIQAIAPKYEVEEPGTFFVRLYVSGTSVGETEFMIHRVQKPPNVP